MFEVIPVNAEHILAFKATGKLTEEDYRRFEPLAEQMIKQQGHISLLIELSDFEGWEKDSSWEARKFGREHELEIDRIAIVGDKAWHSTMVGLSNLFLSIEIRFFPRDEIDDAWSWLNEIAPDMLEKELQPYRHVLFATDFSAHAERAAQRAKQLADLYGARLTLLHVSEDIFYYDDFYDPVIPDREAFEAQLETQALARLHKLAARLGVDESSDVQLLSGTPKRTIVDYARKANADLIVLGSHGRHGIARLLGSVASGVVRNAHCDVLTVRL